MRAHDDFAAAVAAVTAAAAAAPYNEKLRQAAAGGAAGAVAKTVCAPLERVKILCQTGESSGIVATVRNVMRREGVTGLWRGNFANVVRTIPNKGVLFMCSDSIKATLANPKRGETLRQLPAWKSAFAGGCAGALSVLCTYPLDLVRGRLSGKYKTAGPPGAAAATSKAGATAAASSSVSLPTQYQGIVGTMRATVRHEGVGALYRGVGPTLLGCWPYEGLKFAAYDMLQRLAPRSQQSLSSPTLMWSVLSGALAGAIVSSVMFPNDTVRRRLQIQGMSGTKVQFSGAIQCWRFIMVHEGVRGFFRGCGANLLRSVPNAAFQFGAYEYFKAMLQLQ